MNKAELTYQLSKCLLEEPDPPAFLKNAFEIYKLAKPRAGFAELGRKMGFSSRSFVRQLVIGNRQLSLKNYRMVAQGLGLSIEATNYLALLIESRQDEKIRKGFETEINKAETKLRLSLKKKRPRGRGQSDALPMEQWPYVYAALGDETGRPLDEIARISNQSRLICNEILDHMQSKKMIRFDEKTQCYIPEDRIVEIGELGESEIYKRLFKNVVLEVIRRADSDFNSKNSLFYTSIFSVPRHRLTELTIELEKLLANYMSDAEVANGDSLALLSAGLIPLRRHE